MTSVKTTQNLCLSAAICAILSLAPASAAPRSLAVQLASPKGNTLRCSKARDQYALIYNAGPVPLPAGTRVEVHANGPTPQAEGSATGVTPGTVPVGKSFIHPVKFDKTFTTCEAAVAE